MEQRMIGYCRVSSREQNEDRQIIALRNFGIQERDIFLDKQSGCNFERPEYQKMLTEIKAGDLICVQSIDRFGRNYQEITEQWRNLTQKIGVDIVVLDMPLLDTRRGKDLMGTFLSDIVLQVLSFVAENERKNIKSRQSQGIEAAKARGVSFGRPQTGYPRHWDEYFMKWRNGEISTNYFMDVFGLKKSTFYNLVNKYEEMGRKKMGGRRKQEAGNRK